MSGILTILVFAQLTIPIQTRAFLDADGRFVVYGRYYGSELISIDSIKTVAQYLRDNIASRNRTLLLDELKKDLLQQGGYANKGLFGTFEIALPKGGFSDFMGETGKLDVGGYVKITVGGSQTFVSNLSGEARPSWLPELTLKQEMAVNLDGQVGDRMRVFIDHNSERVNETQNKITVTYKGREDEILQEIEGGDTQLSIPATSYTGDIPSHRGLFGLKSTAKFGPLDLVAIASKEQTQTQEVEIEGSTQAQYDTIYAKEWERRRFFWLGTSEQIVELEVYVDDNDFADNNLGGDITLYGEAYLDINDDNVPDQQNIASNYRQGYFTLKREGLTDFYNFVPDANIIELNYSLYNNYVLGVWYVTADGDTVGRHPIDQVDSTIQLKLICPLLQDTASYTYEYEQKNYYQLVSPGSRLDSVQIYLIKSGGERTDRQEGKPFLELLGLDVNPKDGLIDENTVFLSGRGLLKFPEDQPFASTVLNDPDSSIYTDPYKIDKGKYYLFKKTTEARPVYTLPDNVEQVWVYVDDQLQDSTTDYHVDYEEGKIEFRKPILPTSRVRIKVEYSPFFSAAEKSLIGLRGSLRPFGDATLGSSFFYRTESFPSDRVRLREEPFDRMIWEVDFSYPQSLPFLTRAVDWLPLVKTEVPSKMNLNFEGAYSFSKLNAKGEVYVDDLESATIVSSDIAINRISWVPCSKPLGLDESNFVQKRLIWFNPRDQERLQASDIYVDPLDDNEIADVLKVIFEPENGSSFGGLMQYIYSENFDEIENFELIIKGQGGHVHIDFAEEMSEDQLRRNVDDVLVGLGTREDEDKNRDGVYTEQDEDTGLDGVYGDDEERTVLEDDGNDDYDADGYTGRINGTELNRIWDTEDIDRNGVLNSQNRLYSYTINLDDTTDSDTTYYISNAGLQPGWKMFRVPIKDSTWDTVIGAPDWRNIKYIRIWFDHFTERETLLIYKMSATGSRWKNFGIVGERMPPAPSEDFTIAPVNTKTHKYYISPYPEQKDPYGRIKTEGALELRLKEIQEGHTCVAHRRTDDNEDYRAYDTLTFYLYSTGNVRAGLNPVISLRIGSDSLNFYEYTTEFENGELDSYSRYRRFYVAMNNLVDLKTGRIEPGDTVKNLPYMVVGNPSLSKNQFFEIRITNQIAEPLSDTLWFDDVIMVAPKTDIGRTLRSNGSITFADFASVNFSYDESNGRFRRLTEPNNLSTQSKNRGYSITSNLSLNKFLPDNWHFNIPIGFSYRRSTRIPRYSYYADDVELMSEDADEQRATNTSRSYSIGFSKAGSRNWFIKNTLDRLSLNHTRSEAYNRSALRADTTTSETYSGSYVLDPKFDIKILGQLFSLLPRTVNFSAQYGRNAMRSYYRDDVDSLFRPTDYGFQDRRTLTPSMSVTYSPHRIINANYSFTQTRDSVGTRGRFGEEVGRNQKFSASISEDLKLIRPTLSFNSSYRENHSFEVRQNEDLRNVDNTGQYSAEGNVDIQRLFGLLTHLRDETKDTLLTPGSPAWLAKTIESFVSHMQSVKLHYSRQRNSNYLNVRVRPDPRYQWGLVDSIPADDIAPGSYPGRGLLDAYGAHSGLNFKIVSMTGGYTGRLNKTYSYGGDEVRTQSTNYPNLTVNVQRLEALPLLKNFMKTSSISSSFDQSYEERYEFKTTDTIPRLLSDSKGKSFDPLLRWTVNWNKGISSNIDFSYIETRGNNYSTTDTVPSLTINRRGSLRLGYTFSAPHGLRIPLLGGIKFSTNATLNLGFNYARSTNYYRDLQIPTNDTSTLGANIDISANFSSSITGGFNLDYSQTDDKNSVQDIRRVALNLWMNINF
jgi:hypothetical protein